ncbi:protein CHUP1, chloroplastic isoform X2 [Syzygium oleosum]|uniref:protein CHUP1, chloroplastic isoform X2 n=1 Tax=Syzygium oleosum TaxID=219896 RepID=UPI0011D213C7|nr:protein CHUP1, chloroplastic isoform X2 [Syzygium oleosum]
MSLVLPLLKAKKDDGEKMPREDDDSEIALLRIQLEACLARNVSLEKENQELRHEAARLKSQISSLKAHDNERKSLLWKKIQNSLESENVSLQKPTAKIAEHNSPAENLSPRLAFAAKKEREERIPVPPPKPNANLASFKDENGKKLPSAPAPPPPPPPSRSLSGIRAVRRVPEVVELYRALTRKDARMENKSNPTGVPAVTFTKNMIGEIENRSSYLSAIKSDVERQGQFINFLIKEVESAAFKDMTDVEAFVKWLDEELSSLVDERAVLKHFPHWPERKADAMREAAFSYRDLRNLESEVSSFQDNPKEPLIPALRRMQALQDRLEQSINNVERMRESTSKKYRDLQIPWQWMLDTGLIGQMKLSSLRLAKEYMKRIAREMRSSECSQEDNLMLQGVRFAFRVHQVVLTTKP